MGKDPLRVEPMTDTLFYLFYGNTIDHHRPI